jgi:hydrogenase maturation protein HypF
MMNELNGRHIQITGVVQGVGFRPFVYGLAQRHGLTGWIRNSSAGVEIELNGTTAVLDQFLADLQNELPPLAQIDSLTAVPIPANGAAVFEIIASQSVPGAFQPISPDVSICADCLRELFDPHDRRYRYPFINCTNCGPRFTIIRDIPYDRPLTTMAAFDLCPDCAAEYHDPLDRRFHAQPVACPVCGPEVWLEVGSEKWEVGSEKWAVKSEKSPSPPHPLTLSREVLAAGKILAIKGLGGFHLACDGLNETAVAELRRRKLRVDKPFALMVYDLETAVQFCQINAAERELLTSRERPIVLLEKRPDCPIAPSCAPGQNQLGVMLPYTPLHYLLLEPADGFPAALVMTSGNLSEEPIVTDNDEARERLLVAPPEPVEGASPNNRLLSLSKGGASTSSTTGAAAGLADALLLHNRPIETRCDDSVARVTAVTGPYLLRRARGYAPAALKLPWDAPPTLAGGAELKNTFCLTNGRYAFLSHHIGDLENYETLQSFEQGIEHLQRLFRVKPELFAYDLHPNYLATRYILERAEAEGLTAVGVQHHHAHIAACMAEHNLPGDRPVIGLAFDGTGYGDDGAIWGGEILIADYVGYERPYHLDYFRLPGGDKAAREPWRVALSLLHESGELEVRSEKLEVRSGSDFSLFTSHFSLPTSDFSLLTAVQHQLRTGLNAPHTSSMGRLFDGVAALIGLRQTVNYEAQAAMLLEAIVDRGENGRYPFPLDDERGVIDWREMVAAVVADQRAGVSPGQIAARFHNGLAQMALDACRRCRQRYGLNEVALSGGVWQNVTLLARTAALLKQNNFTLYLHQKLPANDGGLALGQAAIAVRREA